MGQCSGKGSLRRIVIVGLDNAGKTTLFNQLQHKDASTIPTIGYNADVVDICGISVIVWDLGGQKRIRDLWSHYMNEAAGVVFVVDSTDHHRIKKARRALHKVMSLPQLESCQSFLILANKQDQEGAIDAAEIAARMRIDPTVGSCSDPDTESSSDSSQSFSCESRGRKLKLIKVEKKWKVQNCSAKTGEGIIEGFRWLLD